MISFCGHYTNKLLVMQSLAHFATLITVVTKQTTPEKQHSLLKRIGIDILGGLFIIGAVLFGWLPGPGGIPLLLAGLGLLAINHEWARKLLVHLKENGLKIASVIFRDHPLLVIAYDVVAIVLIVGGSILFGMASGSVIKGLLIAVIFLGLSLFLGNRKRATRINAFVKRVAKRQNKT